MEAGETVQHVRTLADLGEDTGSGPRTHMVAHNHLQPVPVLSFDLEH